MLSITNEQIHQDNIISNHYWVHCISRDSLLV